MTSDIIISHTPGRVKRKLLTPSWREGSLVASAHQRAACAAGIALAIPRHHEEAELGWVGLMSWGETSRVGDGAACFSRH